MNSDPQIEARLKIKKLKEEFWHPHPTLSHRGRGIIDMSSPIGGISVQIRDNSH
jgi:hypothetical protein